MKFDLQKEIFNNNSSTDVINAIKGEYGDGYNLGSVFMLLNKCLPNQVSLGEINKKYAIEALKNKYQIPEYNVIKTQTIKAGKLKDSSLIVAIRRDLIIDLTERDEFLPDTASIIFGNGVSELELEEISKLMKKRKKKVKTKNKVFLLENGLHGMLHLRSFEVAKKEFDLKNHYNDDFLETSKIIEDKLNSKNENGIVILHGDPGTGKTTYIRYLATAIKKKMIYIPPAFADRLSSPDFLPLLFDYPNSILIIEDAENILAERRAGSNDSISNLLNIADGLLSDCLKIQIVCTFNTPIENIDKALLRKGRLIARYNFKALNLQKTKSLAEKIGIKSEINKESTLSEIYNYLDEDYSYLEEANIGFKI